MDIWFGQGIGSAAWVVVAISACHDRSAGDGGQPASGITHAGDGGQPASGIRHAGDGGQPANGITHGGDGSIRAF